MEETHICTEETCPTGANYFVSAIDGSLHYYMAGPYTTHAAALADVDKARAIADKHDPRGCFMAWGTCKSDRTAPGSINKAGLM